MFIFTLPSIFTASSFTTFILIFTISTICLLPIRSFWLNIRENFPIIRDVCQRGAIYSFWL